LLSTAIGLPLDRVLEVNDMLIEMNENHGPLSGIFSYRYVKGSAATLAFTKFDPPAYLNWIVRNQTQQGISIMQYGMSWKQEIFLTLFTGAKYITLMKQKHERCMEQLLING
jgi:hypothetical protein